MQFDTKMLPLDSPRWKSLSVHFGTPEQVPARLTSWQKSIGKPDEDSEWTNLSEQFLHSGSITDCAYAVVPHVVCEIERAAATKRLYYLADIAWIEATRCEPGSPVLSSDLADGYHGAIAYARRLSVECLSLEWPKTEFRYLLGILACLHGHGVLGDTLIDLSGLGAECPRCGEVVFPENLVKSGYLIM